VNKLKVLAFDLDVGVTVKFMEAIDSTHELMHELNPIVHKSETGGCPNSFA